MATQLLIYVKWITMPVLVWLALVLQILPIAPVNNIVQRWQPHVFYIPLYAIILLGIHAILSVLYGAAKFNDCAEAKAELIREIQEARADLQRRKII